MTSIVILQSLFYKKQNVVYSFCRHRLWLILKDLLLRVQSSDGTKRIGIIPNSTLHDLYDTIYNTCNLTDYGFSLYKERNYTVELESSRTKTVKSSNLNHGDIIYMKQISGSSKQVSRDEPYSVTKKMSKNSNVTSNLREDPVDKIISETDGRVNRKRDPKLCRHNSNGCCIHCSPIEPWDEQYLKDQKIKHLSFHSYIGKLTSGVDRGKFVSLEDLNCKIKNGCHEHLPWPKGICSKCQPSAITLNRQIYRHVDNVMFENTALVERFLNYWRTTGHQRVGYLYGTYEVHSDVPLGIRARVAAIYEPPQESTRDSIKLLDDENSEQVDEFANELGLKKVGWIFTDLISDDTTLGTVKHLRGIATHFLTAHECILAGQLQNQHPNVCKYSSNGIFGSKFVTVCVTGDATKQVHMEGYAVSAQCMALVRDNCLVPTKDAPELGYVRESSDKQFVPDVYYKEKDQYGNEVSRLGRPLPVEYLLVDVPASTPLTPHYTFTVREGKKEFPIENRYLDGHLQDFNAFSTFITSWDSDEFLENVSDFHFLLYLSRMDMIPMTNDMPILLEAVRTKNNHLAMDFKNREVWKTLETLVAASLSSSGDDPYANGTASNSAETWTCRHCTFINKSELSTCEMCGLPTH